MGQGDKFNSFLSTRGGRMNFITKKDIIEGDHLAKIMLSEMNKEGFKFDKSKIEFATKLENGNKIFLESDAVKHIIERHSQDFEGAFGIKENDIVPFLGDTISKGKLISSNYRIINGKECYSNKYYYKGKYCVVYGIAENGYIETAYPR